MEKIVVTLIGVVGIGFVYWFFLKKNEEVTVASGSIDILVNGGYTPQVIQIPKNKPTTLRFLRKDPSSCLEEIVLPDFKMRKFLPLNETTSISITPKKTGTFEMVCGMNMFHGKIIVK